jgi:hypothetical protein
MDTIRLERGDAGREREALVAERARLMTEISVEKDAFISEKDWTDYKTQRRTC